MNQKLNLPCVLFAGHGAWHLNTVAVFAAKRGLLSGAWFGSKRVEGIPPGSYRRIWPYYIAQKVFQKLPFTNLEERMRWINLPFYDAWMRGQSLSCRCNVVQGAMGACKPLFAMAARSSQPVLKVFDAPNSHPENFWKIWQNESDRFCPGYRIPFPKSTVRRITQEIQSADMVLCPSEFVRDSMVSHGVDPQKCFVHSFGADLEVFNPRAELPSIPTFITVGSICLRKGHQYLFPAFRALKESFPNARLVCVGEVRPDFQDEWPKWVGTFEHVPHISHADLSHRLRSATGFVFPSLEEGFARVLSEAMASGLPIIATHESGATTVMQHGVHGLVVKPRDEVGLTGAMEQLITDPQLNLHMGLKAFHDIASQNSWEDYTNKLFREYEHRLVSLA